MQRTHNHYDFIIIILFPYEGISDKHGSCKYRNNNIVHALYGRKVVGAGIIMIIILVAEATKLHYILIDIFVRCQLAKKIVKWIDCNNSFSLYL